MSAGVAQTLIARFRQTKIENLHRAVRQQHDVARLQIAVNDASSVCCLQTFSRLSRDVQSVANRHAAITTQPCAKSLPLVKRHRQKQPTAVSGRDFVDVAKVWVIERSSRVSFAHKSCLSRVVEVVVRQEKLERHSSAQLCIVRSIHNTHTSRTKRVTYDVVRDGPSGDAERVRLSI